MKFNIFKGDRASDGAMALKAALDATMLKAEGSTYTGRRPSCIINWGNSGAEARRLKAVADGAGRRFYNAPQAVALATDKLAFFRKMQADAPEITIPWCDNITDAVTMAENGGRVFARTVLNGHSGRGIELLVGDQEGDRGVIRQIRDNNIMPTTLLGEPLSQSLQGCRLFTLGVLGKRTEFRVHIFRHEAILTQIKLRREGFAELPGYNSIVRNVASGWVYGVQGAEDAEGAEAARAAAARAVDVLGLDFGAVDIVYKTGTGVAYVLEVNTAPGLEETGSALTAYKDAFTNA